MPLKSSSALRLHIRDRLVPTLPLQEADQIARLIIEALFGISISAQLLDRPIQISLASEREIGSIIQRLLKHEPIQYVLGYSEFFGHRFKTDNRALIPRPETEELVQMVLQQQISQSSTILDVGTGSGCIAISLALACNSQVYAIDLDSNTLDLARENAKALTANVQFIHADFLTDLVELPVLDIIVSNPPYVPESDLPSLEARVRDYEPSAALFVSDHDPLIFYRRMVEIAPLYLKPGGQVFMEIYHTAGPDIVRLFEQSRWSQVQVTKDINGNDRLLHAILHSG